MSAAAPARSNALRALIGTVLIAAGVCLVCWAAFNVIRGPSSCGGDAPACPDGLLGALLGGVAGIFVVLPVGIVVAPKVAGLPSAVLALLSGGLAATVYASRFVADPITDGTVGTWIAVGLLGALALLGLLGVLVGGTADPDALRAKLADTADARAVAAERARLRADDRPVSRQTADEVEQDTAAWLREQGLSDEPDRPAATGSDLGLGAIHDLLTHGLASGQLAADGKPGGFDKARQADVQRLIDLHRRGVIGDDALRDGLRALRD